VNFSVTDSGIGIATADLPRLGEAFFRADQELVTSQKGYGLGLAVASGLLALMQSALACQSSLGAGSTFSFTIQGAT
jgi:signal transduction histidine kinase